MALNRDNYTNLSAEEIHGIQKVYISDYLSVKNDLEVASEKHNSGQFPTVTARKKVAELVRRKLAILADINFLGLLIDEKDGTLGFALI